VDRISHLPERWLVEDEARSDYSSIAASTNPAGSSQNSRMTL
jgi:hypothetical protein